MERIKSYVKVNMSVFYTFIVGVAQMIVSGIITLFLSLGGMCCLHLVQVYAEVITWRIYVDYVGKLQGL